MFQIKLLLLIHTIISPPRNPRFRDRRNFRGNRDHPRISPRFADFSDGRGITVASGSRAAGVVITTIIKRCVHGLISGHLIQSLGNSLASLLLALTLYWSGPTFVPDRNCVLNYSSSLCLYGPGNNNANAEENK